MKTFQHVAIAILSLSLSVSAGEAHPTLSLLVWRRIHSDADIFTAKVEKVERHILYKNQVVQEELEDLEKRLLKLLESEGDSLKEFVKLSNVITTIELRVMKSHEGDKKVGELVEIVVVDKVGDLCKTYQQLPINKDLVASEHVWAISKEEGPFETKIEQFYWTSSELWSEIRS